jgi:hypothetical protein
LVYVEKVKTKFFLEKWTSFVFYKFIFFSSLNNLKLAILMLFWPKMAEYTISLFLESGAIAAKNQKYADENSRQGT